MQQVMKLPAKQAIASPVITSRIMDVRRKFFRESDEIASAYAEREKFHFSKMISESEKLSNCTTVSLYGVFMDMAALGLSFDPSMKHASVVPYGKKAQLQIGGQGELLLRIRCGQILSADTPVLVYESEANHFQVNMVNGKIQISYQKNIFRKKEEKPIACFMRIVRPDGSEDFAVQTVADMEYLRGFSKDPNSTAWTKGYAGMFVTKTIKHAFKAYPKSTVLEKMLAATKFSKLETETIEPEMEIDYGINEETGEVVELNPNTQQAPPMAPPTGFDAPATMNPNPQGYKPDSSKDDDF
jgi:phage RecT family recombinase